jgi:hypothetical protein
MSKALRAAFHRLVHRLRPLPVGSRLMMARYRHFIAACSVGSYIGDPACALAISCHVVLRLLR